MISGVCIAGMRQCNQLSAILERSYATGHSEALSMKVVRIPPALAFLAFQLVQAKQSIRGEYPTISARIPRMEPTALPAEAGPAPVELIVQNGRLRGSSRPLHQPLTMVGRATGCDVRLNASGVSPLHCALVLTSKG